MAPTSACPKCGDELAADAPSGICPKCLLQAGLDGSLSEAESAAEAQTLPTDIQGSAASASVSLSGTKVRYFGEYELLEEIARGGMGVVYKARQVKLNRIVAVKMILAGELANQADVERFYTEARAAANLHHPGIVAIHEVGQHDGQHYFSMDYVAGESLANRIARGPLPAREAVTLTKTVAQAVSFAHVEGVIHRDLKPANILLDAQGEPHVTDFGLAKHVRGETGSSERKTAIATAESLTATGQVLGTPSYMPPEQAVGKTKEIGPRSDVYSLGAVLYCTLTGRPPFQAASTLDTLLQVLDRDPVSPQAINSAVPRDLETICLKCLEKDPQHRYASAKDLVDELQRFLDGKPIKARPISAAARAWRWCRRKPALAAAGALAATAILATVVLAVSFAIYQSRVADYNRRTLAENHFDKGQSLCEEGDVARGMFWFVRSLQTAPRGATDLQRAIRAGLGVWHAPGARLRMVWDHQAGTGVSAITFSTDGKTLLTAYNGHTVQLWDPATGKPIGGRIRHNGHQDSQGFSPDGKMFAVGSNDQDVAAVLWDTATGKPIRQLRLRQEDLPQPGMNGSARRTAFSPDGKTLLAGCWGGTVQLWDVATGNPIGPAFRDNEGDRKLHKDWVEDVAISPDGKVVATASRDKTARLWDATTGKPMCEPLPHESWVVAVAFSPDGKTLLTGCSSGAQLWDTDTGKPLGDPLIHPGIYAVAISPDGTLLLTGSNDRTARLWDVATHKLIGVPLRHDHYVEAVAFSPDGKTAATAGGRDIRLWDLPKSSQPAEIILRHDNPVTAAAFSPDGSMVGTGSYSDYENRTRNDPPPSSEARLWDAATGEPLGDPLPRQPHQERPLKAAFSPDGKIFAMLGEFWDYEGYGMRSAIHLWDVATRQPVGQPLVQKVDENARWGQGVERLDFAADGKTLTATDLEGLIQVWDLATGKPVGPPAKSEGGVPAAVSADGNRRLSGHCEDNTAWFRDTVTGKAGSVQHRGSVNAVAISPDGTLLLTGSHDHTARLWDAATQKPIGPPLKHDGPVGTVAFSSDGKTVLTASSDKTARLWRVPPVAEGELERLALWPEVITGTRLETLTLHALKAEDWLKCKHKLDKLGGSPLP